MNGTIAILTLLNVMAIVCWLYFKIADHNHMHFETE